MGAARLHAFFTKYNLYVALRDSVHCNNPFDGFLSPLCEALCGRASGNTWVEVAWSMRSGARTLRYSRALRARVAPRAEPPVLCLCVYVVLFMS